MKMCILSNPPGSIQWINQISLQSDRNFAILFGKQLFDY